MALRVGVAKAAQLLGVSRHELQRLIRNGELQTFEGRLGLDELRERFPRLAIDEEQELERVELLRSTAFARRVCDELAPDPDLLEVQLRKRQADLAVAQAKAVKYREVVEDVAQLLCDLQETDDEQQKEIAGFISRWLLRRLEK